MLGLLEKMEREDRKKTKGKRKTKKKQNSLEALLRLIRDMF